MKDKTNFNKNKTNSYCHIKRHKRIFKSSISIFQIIILIISILSTAYFLGESLPIVSANGNDSTNNSGNSSQSELGSRGPPIQYLGLTSFLKKTFLKSVSEFSKRLEIFGAMAAATVVLTFLITWISTGDIGKAARVATRTAVGAAVGLAALEGLTKLGIFGAAGPAGWMAAAFITLGIILVSMFQGETDRTVTFQCKLWQPPSGGSDCSLCNNNLLPCTEYQCKSLGAGCELINKNSDEPRCIWKNERDIAPPTITPWAGALQPGYRYEPIPGGRGVEVKYQSQRCLPEWTPFTIGIELDKEGYCKLDFVSTRNFSQMRFDFDGSTLYKKRHIQQFTFPGAQYILRNAAINITNAGQFNIYVRCESINGKSNIDEFLFKFCTNDEPDNTPPIITGFNPRDGTPVAYFNENQQRLIRVQVFTNEPAQCKWSMEDQNYESMENMLYCPLNPLSFNANLNYVCSGNLTGLQNNLQNKFYFRCNDTFGNINTQSRTLTLLGTEALYISSVSPNATIVKGSTSPVKVTLRAQTNAGFRRGEAICSYSNNNAPGSYIRFSNTSTNSHSTNLYLGSGDYVYYIRCYDEAGNSDTKIINFEVQTDTSPPIVVRAYKEAQNLKIVTNEEGRCVYSTNNNLRCEYDFNQGLNMTRSSNKKIHSTNWDKTKTYYIKCQDEFENRPLPNFCSIEIRPFDIGP
ncbi:MAG: hypothetical protein QXX55_01880 [Candidatus Pacearchaeota archaeon]